ncbi:MAG: Uma2 family endonuclease [Chloroflexi bacterium]|nr:Uma2 family endonuclease [Chloroflexota bacterium]MYD47235.1 Uma2 family endonuclease [Chloroflexota bacterium]
MTTSDATTKIAKPKGRFRLPDPPEREPDDMTSAEHLSETGLHHHLKQFLGNPETTIVSGEKYVTARRGAEMRYPDLLVAFGVDPAAYRETNGYVVSEQSKPPDLVLEIASEGTGHIDVGEKREFYERLGIGEYWRFDATGEYHGARLAGDRLVNGRYEPIDVAEVSGGVLEGYSAALSLNWRWHDGRLGCLDPATGRHIATFESERDRADTAESRADAAEARVSELEEQLRRQGQ